MRLQRHGDYNMNYALNCNNCDDHHEVPRCVFDSTKRVRRSRTYARDGGCVKI